MHTCHKAAGTVVNLNVFEADRARVNPMTVPRASTSRLPRAGDTGTCVCTIRGHFVATRRGRIRLRHPTGPR